MGARRTPFWKTLADKTVLFVLVFLVWIALAGTSTQELVVGAIVSILVMTVTAPFFNLGTSSVLNPFRLINFVCYLVLFVFQAVLAHGMMIRLVLEGDVEPAIVKIRPRVRTEFGRASLSNAITLTPGTMVVDEDENHIYVHAIKLGKHDPPESVAMPYERYVTGFAE